MTESQVVLKYPTRIALNPFISTIGWALPQLFYCCQEPLCLFQLWPLTSWEMGCGMLLILMDNRKLLIILSFICLFWTACAPLTLDTIKLDMLSPQMIWMR